MLDILLAAVAALTSQASTTWQVIDINAEAKRVLAVDVATKPTTLKPDAIVKARIFVTVDMPDISALTGYWVIDCGKNLHQVRDTATFDKAGKASAPDLVPMEWEANPSGSLFEAVANYVCRGQPGRPGELLTGAAPIAAANALLTKG